MVSQFFWVIFSCYFSIEVTGHGYMIVPPNRASLWRIDHTQPANFNDNEYFCGGHHVQYQINGGRCGPCGDDWREPVPRSNENGGTHGKGIIVANYTAGSVITVTTLITANHLGNLYFHICKLKNPSDVETERCFHTLTLADGTIKHPIHPLDQEVQTQIKLPKGFTCERCVLRWHYRTGNSWGMCDDGTENIGCGNQEIFRSCADIRILPARPSDEVPLKIYDESSESSDDYSFEIYKNQPCIINPYYKTDGKKNKQFKNGF